MLSLQETQEDAIRIKQEYQRIRLNEIELQGAGDKQTKRQLAAIRRRKIELDDDLSKIMEHIKSIQVTQSNVTALLVLSITYPWLKTGGEMMH